ncbi:hypothetical protein ACFWBN_31575 [Streptomyces sp. NPDC059989]|uniref:hypothetical protein n=1 Tax=Streptomyces sp. NPDC059989 TaxID=3347026 RepID=UPI0036AC3926
MTSRPGTYTHNGWRLIAASAVLGCAGALLLYAGLRPHAEPGAGTPPRQTSAAVRTVTPLASVTEQAAGGVGAADATGPAPSPAGRTSRPHEVDGAGAAGLSLSPATAAALATSPTPTPSGPGELPPPGSGEAADPLIQQVIDTAAPRDLPTADETLLLYEGRVAWLAETDRYTQVRIQAATARRGPAGGAVVRLVWAGADPAGTFLDGRPAAVHFTQNGDGTWTRTS